MTQHADAVVLGAGMAGLNVARSLRRKGLRVVIVDAPQKKGVASPKAAGMLDPFLDYGSSHPVVELGLKAGKGYPDYLAQISGGDPQRCGYERTGLICTANSPRELSVLRKRFAWQRGRGLRLHWLEGDELRKQFPGIPDLCRAAVSYPQIGRVQPAKLLKVLRRHVLSLGVRVVSPEVPVRVLVRNGAVGGIQAGSLGIRTPVVVQASGAWSGMNQTAGISVPVVPARGQIVMVKGRLPQRVILHGVSGTYLVPWERGSLLAGSTVELKGYRPVTTRAGREDIRRRIRQLYPAAGNFTEIRAWAGLRPFCRDQKPLIGATAVSGYYLATGYYRSGILISALAGDLLAKGMLTGRMPGLLSRFSPLRFGPRGNAIHE